MDMIRNLFQGIIVFQRIGVIITVPERKQFARDLDNSGQVADSFTNDLVKLYERRMENNMQESHDNHSKHPVVQGILVISNDI